MPARVSRFKIKDGSYDAVMGIVNSHVCAALKEVDGLEHLLSTLNRERNEGTVIAAYRDAAAMQAAQPKIAAIWGSMGEHLAGPPDTTIEELVLRFPG